MNNTLAKNEGIFSQLPDGAKSKLNHCILTWSRDIFIILLTD